MKIKKWPKEIKTLPDGRRQLVLHGGHVITESHSDYLKRIGKVVQFPTKIRKP